jgi:hypothetical protein
LILLIRVPQFASAPCFTRLARTDVARDCGRTMYQPMPPDPVKPAVESALDSNDTRMQQVTYADGKLYGALDTAVTAGGATKARPLGERVDLGAVELGPEERVLVRGQVEAVGVDAEALVGAERARDLGGQWPGMPEPVPVLWTWRMLGAAGPAAAEAAPGRPSRPSTVISAVALTRVAGAIHAALG